MSGSLSSGGHRFGLEFFFQRRSPGAFYLGYIQLDHFLAVALDPQTICSDTSQQGHRAAGRRDNLFDVSEQGLIKANDDA